jgi:hypothetical protein
VKASEMNAGPILTNNASFYVNYDKTTMTSMYEELVTKVDEEITFASSQHLGE